MGFFLICLVAACSRFAHFLGMRWDLGRFVVAPVGRFGGVGGGDMGIHDIIISMISMIFPDHAAFSTSKKSGGFPAFPVRCSISRNSDRNAATRDSNSL